MRSRLLCLRIARPISETLCSFVHVARLQGLWLPSDFRGSAALPNADELLRHVGKRRAPSRAPPSFDNAAIAELNEQASALIASRYRPGTHANASRLSVLPLFRRTTKAIRPDRPISRRARGGRVAACGEAATAGTTREKAGDAT
jgi:hypothetical protein